MPTAITLLLPSTRDMELRLAVALLVPSAMAFAPASRVPQSHGRAYGLRMQARELDPQTTAADAAVLEAVVDRAVESYTGVARQSIISVFDPNQRFWLVRRWRSTVLQAMWPHLALNTLCTLSFMVWVCRRSGASGVAWPIFMPPDPTAPLMVRLAPLYIMWTHHATLTTFVLTFFIAEAFTYWKRALCHGRVVQRCLLDIMLLVTTHATREAAVGRPEPEGPEEPEEVDPPDDTDQVAWARPPRILTLTLTLNDNPHLSPSPSPSPSPTPTPSPSPSPSPLTLALTSRLSPLTSHPHPHPRGSGGR